MHSFTKIDSSDSEGAFENFISHLIDDEVESVVEGISTGDTPVRGGDVVIELDDICAPTFVYGGKGGGGPGNRPGRRAGKLRFTIPLAKLMPMIAEQLDLPNLRREGAGHITEDTEVYRTISRVGRILDRKHTFKRGLKTSIGMGLYDPEDDQFEVFVRKKDRRYKQTIVETKPKYRAVVFFVNDVSYSTAWGERLELEKRIVNFIQAWIDWNYGVDNVEHRYFVHDVEAHEVPKSHFYNVSYMGGTYAYPAFQMIHRIATEDYNLAETNHYLFYFGDGELFGDDSGDVAKLLDEEGKKIFNAVGICEVQPSTFSNLVHSVKKIADSTVRVAILNKKKDIIPTIKLLFGATSKSKPKKKKVKK